MLRLFNKTCSIGWFFKSVDDSLDTIFDQFYIPVYQKAEFNVLEFEIGDKLRHMNWMNFVNRLIFDNNKIVNQFIYSITLIKFLSVIEGSTSLKRGGA